MASPRLFREERWPTVEQQRLLDAVLGDGDVARDAWRWWRNARDLEAIDTLDAATLHVIPPLFLNLRRLGLEDEIPPRLRAIHRMTWARNQLALRTVAEITRTLTARDVDVLAMKGVALLLGPYADPGARMMHDVDVLVRERQATAAFDALAEAGWTFEHSRPEDEHIPFLNAAALRHEQWTELDLHWRPFTVDCAREHEAVMWDRTVAHDIHGAAVRVPDPVDQLLLLCMHARRPDPQGGCRWVVDAATLLDTTDDLDPDALLERAAATGLLLPVLDTLTWLHAFRGIARLAPIADRARQHEPTDAELRRYAAIMREPLPARGVGEVVRTLWWRYAGSHAGRGRRASRIAFVGFILRHFRRVWGLPAWRVPFKIARECLRRAGL